MSVEVKGSVVKGLKSYVEKKYPSYADSWMSAMDSQTREVFKQPILSTTWYDLQVGVVNPTKALAEVTGKKVKDVAYESGQFVAEDLLSGIYKVFVAIASPKFVISRATTIFDSFYRPVNVSLPLLEPGCARIKVEGLTTADGVLESRIEGFMQVTVSKSAGKDVKVKSEKASGDGNPYTEYTIEWS
ncbi:hypothetical protein FUAX_37230 [Fulvitalea axinellae]|uniref:Uncharacterized protein n=1 Tax=Fulvitalea axinellae TaxID=1182444 RepID=A0AAU9DDM4_9BACT|nr:hypothetical protein FUAX_37230 [Fulvitalea axinellae]